MARGDTQENSEIQAQAVKPAPGAAPSQNGDGRPAAASNGSAAPAVPAAPAVAAAPGPDSSESAAASRRPGWVRPLMLTILAVVVLAGAAYGYRFWRFAATHVSTDDAAVTVDLVQIAPQVSGTISQVMVKENQHVQKGDLLVTLDDSVYRSAVAQAQANLDAAIASAKGAGASVELSSETGSAQVAQAQGAVSQAESSIASAGADVARSHAGVINARATAGSVQAQIGTAQAAVNAAVANRQGAVDAVTAAQAQLETARAAVRVAQSGVDVAQTAAEKAERDAARFEALLKEGAISEQAADTARAAARSARAQLESSRQQVRAAETSVLQRQADLQAARQKVGAADAAIPQAKAQVTSARDQAKAAQAGVGQALAVEKATREGVNAAAARRAQALGQLSQAQTAPRQVQVSQSAQAQAAAKVEQARAALESATIQLEYTRIVAPVSGRISKKSGSVGALVQIGTPLMAIVSDKPMWVVANIKETQLAGVRPGTAAEVEVDALPGHTFKGHVESLSAATGSTFALLPPDNATGNFTKVVQRVPVKIVLEQGQKDIDLLRAGMSVTAVVDLGK